MLGKILMKIIEIFVRNILRKIIGKIIGRILRTILGNILWNILGIILGIIDKVVVVFGGQIHIGGIAFLIRPYLFGLRKWLAFDLLNFLLC